jgi:hypothetical protein
VGCDKFEDINTNPDTPTTVPSSMLATKLVHEMLRKDRTVKESANDGVLAKQITWNEGSSDLQYNNIGRGDYELFWQVTNCNDMVTKSPGHKGYEGLALFTKAYFLYYISLNMGDIPYSGAGQGEDGNIKPKYDTQKEVMQSVLRDLEAAYQCFSVADETAFEGDIIFNGNRENWKKTITAFQLKVLINLSKKESESDMNIKSRFAGIVQNGLLMTSNADNFQLTYKDQQGMKYPFNDLTSNQTKYAMMSTTLVDRMKEYNDYRLFYYGEPARAKLEEGKAESDYDAYVGVDPSLPFGEVSKAHGANLYCMPNYRYISETHVEGEPMVRLGYSEQQFILAEACLRGWISGNVSTYYKKGIEAHMTFIKDVTPDEYAHGRLITPDYIASYLAGDVIQLTGNFEKDLEKIITQKYLSYYLQHAMEAYYDYRRTGYPVLPINPESSKNVTAPDRIPVRYMYPNGEYNYNRENLEEALSRQFNGNDDINDVMWILK